MKVLFLTMSLNGYHGSVVHVKEYAQYFKQNGWDVYVGSVKISPRIRQELENSGIIVENIDQIPIDEDYDLVYALHLLLFPTLLQKGLKYKKAIMMTLSVSEPIEQIPPSVIWPQFDMMAVVSEEIILRYQRSFGINPDLFTVIPNHIPLNFLKMSERKQSWSENIGKVCVVSNHYVPELAELKTLAPFAIAYYGCKYAGQIPITPELLLQYDVVITIGKTVQYCLGLGIPVYEYDHFGGCGFITLENFRTEEKTNFSGRGTRRRLGAAELLQDMLGTYPMACRQASGLRAVAVRLYGINQLVEKQLQQINSRNHIHPKLNTDAKLFCNAAFAALQYIFGAMRKSEKSASSPTDGVYPHA